MAYVGASVHGQEAVRMSMASAEAAEARQKAMELGYCNLKYGSITGRVDAGMGVIYSDNVYYSENDTKGDTALRPALGLKAIVPVSDVNSLYFSTGLGYLKYLSHSDLDSFYVTPDSELEFLVYAGDFVINTHERFALTQNGAQTPSMGAANNLGKIENTSGVGADWDLNKLVLSLGGDYKISQYTYSDYKYLNHDDLIFTSRASLEITPIIKTGIEGGGGIISYETSRLSDKVNYNAGPFIKTTLNRYLTTTLSAGYVNYNFESGREVNGHQNLDSFYARWVVQNRLNRYIYQSLSVSHYLNVGYWYEMDELYAFQYYLIYRINEKMALSGGPYYQTGKAYYSYMERDEDWGGVNLNFDYTILKKLKTTLSYWLSKRNVDSVSSYTQNRLALTVTYTF